MHVSAYFYGDIFKLFIYLFIYLLIQYILKAQHEDGSITMSRNM